MKRNVAMLLTVLLIFMLSACTGQPSGESSVPQGADSSDIVKEDTAPASGESLNGFTLSDMVIKVTCGERTATFRLYDTNAAKELYAQLSLSLELTNFRDAQWMFYPSEKLNVTENEAYHDGKKGELSYYEPWDDVFMLYEDFYAGDEMHRLGVCLTGIEEIAGMTGSIQIEQLNIAETPQSKGGENMIKQTCRRSGCRKH